MKYTWQLVGAYAVATATTLAGCAATKVSNAPAGLPTQQLHNVARPEAPKSWLPKMMQSPGAKTKTAASGSSSLAHTLPTDGKKHKPIDPLTMARLQERRGQTQQAVQLYEAELKKQPKNAAIHHRLAVIAARTGQWEKAETHFRAATELDPSNSQLMCDCGYALYLQHQLDAAESCLRTAVQLNPSNKAAHNNLGIVLGVQAKYDDSLMAFRQGGSEAEAQANLGYVYMQLGDIDQAMAQMNHALTLDSKLRPAALALIQLNDLKRKLQPAVEAEAPLVAQQKNSGTADTMPEAHLAAGIEIASRPAAGTARLHPAIEEQTTAESHEPIDGSLTEYRFRLARQQNAEASSDHDSRFAHQERTKSTPDTVVQASAELPPGQNVSARILTDAAAEQVPARVYKPSNHLQQVRNADHKLNHPAEHRTLRQVETRRTEKSLVLSQSRDAQGAAAIVASDRAGAAGARSVVVLPATGDTPALLPQIRMPRPDEMLPPQAHLNQLPTNQLHPAAASTWTAPQTTNVVRSSLHDSENLPPIRTLPSGN